MIGDAIFLQTLIYSRGGFGSLLDSLSQMGFFSFVLPFLLIFALIYGLLLRVKLFEKDGINAIIALSVSLMALQFDFVPLFFSQIFPRVGVGLAVILAVLIVIGIFVPKQTWVVYALFGVSLITIIMILVGSADALGWSYGSGIGYWLMNNWTIIFGIIFVGVVIALIVMKDKPVAPTFDQVAPNLLKGLFGAK
jgi:hypothetical protein